ncbi:hypothetical protein L6164_022117 [Bauhinia variegata]|nr:hypothetical protein L6164_022117 [Bauhinia variegata]
MSIGLEGETENGNSMYSERIIMEREADGEFRNAGRTESMKPVDEKISRDYRLPYFAASRLDLNTRGENEAPTNCKQLDLNGFSWS